MTPVARKRPPRKPTKPRAKDSASTKPPAKRRAPRKPPAKSDPPPEIELTNVERVRGDLKDLGADLEKSALAGAALTLAKDLDNLKNSATSHAMCSKAMLDLMDRLRELAPPKQTSDGIDKITGKHSRRRQHLRAVR